MGDSPPASRPVALLLNATSEPLCVISVQRAVILILTGKAVCVTDGEGLLHSERQQLVVPSVIRLSRYVRVPYRTQVSITRRGIFARDGWHCAYCSAPADTIDHVLPRSRGGPHAWENVVAACARCNHRKAARTLAELGWRLTKKPTAPHGPIWRILSHRKPDPRWNTWLGMPKSVAYKDAA